MNGILVLLSIEILRALPVQLKTKPMAIINVSAFTAVQMNFPVAGSRLFFLNQCQYLVVECPGQANPDTGNSDYYLFELNGTSLELKKNGANYELTPNSHLAPGSPSNSYNTGASARISISESIVIGTGDTRNYTFHTVNMQSYNIDGNSIYLSFDDPSGIFTISYANALIASDITFQF
jgi:hypothetical protein